MKATADLTKDGMTGRPSKPLRDDAHKYGGNKEAISSKYAAMREQSRQASFKKPVEKNITSAKVSLLDASNNLSENGNATGGPSSGVAATWQSMKLGFQSIRANLEARKFIPLRNVQENKLVSHDSSESLDEIFQRLKRPTLDQGNYSGEDGDEMEIGSSALMR